MKITNIYSGPNGESHFRDIEVTFRKDVIGLAGVSKPIKASEVIFREAAGADSVDWHNAPCRQFIIVLKGEAEIEVSDGSKRHFSPGGIFLAEDTTGRGHRSRAFDRTAIYIPIEGEVA